MSDARIFRQDDGTTFLLGRELGSGGEGKIFAIEGDPRLVAKLYHKPTKEKADKLGIMMRNIPRDKTRYEDPPHTSIAWPSQHIYDTRNSFCGFTMPYIEFKQTQPLLKLYNPSDRLSVDPGFNWKLLLNTAFNMSSVILAIHSELYIIGDLNESNILVTPEGLITLVDCDSMQVRVPIPKSRKERVFYCPVGKPEYTPPELQGKDFSTVKREEYHDDFGLAVLIFMMLMEGRHPFSGVWRGEGPPPTIAQNIQAGRFPYTAKANAKLVPSKYALPFDILPEEVSILMQQCFEDFLLKRPKNRPKAHQWMQALDAAEKKLQQCPKNPEHWFSEHLKYCPWCWRKDLGLPDPFPNVYGTSPSPTKPPPAPRVTTKNTPAHTPTVAPDDVKTTSYRKSMPPAPVGKQVRKPESSTSIKPSRRRKKSQTSYFTVNVLVMLWVVFTIVLYVIEFSWLSHQQGFPHGGLATDVLLVLPPTLVGALFAFLWKHISR